MDKSIAIIPARGGSTRIKNKNIKSFHGSPIISYSILTAIKSNLFSHIYVITDSSEIAKVAKDFGAECPFFLPPKIAENDTGLTNVLLYAIKQMKIKEKYLCCLLATAPMIQIKDLIKGFNLISKQGAHSCCSVSEFSFPVLRSMHINEKGQLQMNWPEYEFVSSNNLRKNYQDAGQFYWLNIKSFFDKKTILGDSVPIILPQYRVVDIDNIEDWERAELMFKLLNI